jgi:Flp pilus assembly protein protease CpaA
MDNMLVAQVTISFCFLAYAAYKDWKLREVPNHVWLLYALFTLPLAAINLCSLSMFEIGVYSASVMILSTVSITAFYFNGWGGADAKAVICLSFSLGYSAANILFLGLIFYFLYSAKHKFKKLKEGYNAPFLVFLFASFVLWMLMGLR